MDLNETLAGMRAKTDAATPGPWQNNDGFLSAPEKRRTEGTGNTYPGTGDWAIFTAEGNYVEAAAYELVDAEFIAMARTAMPALLSAVQGVLALCDEYEAQARGDNPEDRLRQAARKAVALRFRAALQDAIGGE